MESLKELYKIGYGPSGSHTMGPRKVAEIFRLRTLIAKSYTVIVITLKSIIYFIHSKLFLL